MKVKIRLAVFIAVVAGLAELTRSASAADVETDTQVVYKPPAAYETQIVSAPFASFSGCFAGGNVGGDLARWGLTETSPVSVSGSLSGPGITGGGQVGCDYQVGSWVFGFQGMLDGTGIRATSSPIFGAGTAQTSFGVTLTESWLGTGTGRFGYAIIPPLLLYGRGGIGLAQGQNVGWTAGAGIEWRLLPEVSLLLEYDYLGFGSRNVTYTAPGSAVAVATSSEMNVQALLVGLNYRFYLGPAVTTRY